VGKADWELDLEKLLIKWHDSSDFIEFQTSGSTGKPKKIKAKKTDLKSSAERTVRHFLISDGIILNCLSVNHIAGAMQVVRSQISGCQLQVLKPQKDPFENTEIDWQKVQLLSLVPYQLEHIIEKYQQELKHCRVILLGGGPSSKSLKYKALTLGFQNIFETFGMTETLSHIAVKNITLENEFTCLDGVKVKLDSENRLIIDDEKLGIKNLISNDLGLVLNEKKFIWKGRFDNVINSGGIKFSPEEIETKLQAILTDNDFFVFSLPHPSLGESVNLLIESEKELPLTEKLIQESLVLSNYEKPKNIFYINHFLRTETQKVQRKETLKLIEN
jgi:o-succinylbenzoate---CoA ligase